MKIVTGILLLSALLLSGCASNRISGSVISSAKDVQLTNAAFVVLPGEKPDSHFNEYKKYLENLMTRLGYRLPAAGEKPALAVRLSYHIGEPMDIPESTSLPTSVATGGMTGTMTNGMTTYKPTYASGYGTHTVMRKYYMTSLSLIGLDIRNPDSGRQEELWNTKALYHGPMNDLTVLLPYMMEASGKFIGRNTKRNGEIFDIDRDDSNVVALRPMSIKGKKDTQADRPASR